MPSPFPGMNPYLEQADIWDDFHQSFLTEMRNRLAAQAGKRYIVKLEAKVYLHELSSEERAFLGRGDIGVSHLGPAKTSVGASGVLEAPFRFQIPAVDEERSSYIEIRDRERRTLVTVIEMLSPANKYSGPDREAFIAKRQNFLHGPINYVELDLMRGGPRLPVPGLPACDYCCVVRRAADSRVGGSWPLGLRDPLPTIPVPLRAPDPDIQLNLQEILHAVYDTAHYENHIYLGSPEPALTGADAEWAKQFVPKA
jgi:hypothetical protein